MDLHCCFLQVSLLLFSTFLYHTSESKPVKVLFERANMSFVNLKYLDMATINVRRANRKSPYALNVEGITKHTWADNVTIHFEILQYLHNEYRPSFVELHITTCKFVNKEPYIGAMFKKAGIVCPVLPGHYKLPNMMPITSAFPNVFPFEKGRIDVTFSADNGDVIVKCWVEATFKS